MLLQFKHNSLTVVAKMNAPIISFEIAFRIHDRIIQSLLIHSSNSLSFDSGAFELPSMNQAFLLAPSAN